ncbi:MAG: Holliday junction resolvase RuvX [Acidimicrobiia bacterium]|nr:Holliday junction resolvase RuvX [Acidimicrobiia bacterium]
MPRVLGLDLGSRRIGVAVSAGAVATPYAVLQRGRNHAVDHATVAALVSEVGAERVVVGLPRSLDGTMGPAAKAAAAEAEALGDVLGVPVETYDERLTTVTADRSLSSLGLSGQARRRVVDKVAAAVMLQAWLDRTCS